MPVVVSMYGTLWCIPGSNATLRYAWSMWRRLGSRAWSSASSMACLCMTLTM